MKFLITRVSNHCRDNIDNIQLSDKWCVREETYDGIEQMKFKSFEEFKNYNGVDFTSEGVDHYAKGGCIFRTIKNKHKGCFIDIVSLDDLLLLQHEVGDIIITNDIFNKNIKQITIYDDYIE